MEYISNDKIQKMKLTQDNVCIITDFDKTLTKSNCSDSWDAAANRKVFGDGLADELNLLYKKYGPIETNYDIDMEQKEKYMIEWYDKCMDLYYKYKITKDKLDESIQESNLELRQEAIIFLQDMKDKNIPVIILSAGIGNSIEKCLKMANCYFNNVYIISNFIKFEKNGKMQKFSGKMLHSLNKNIDDVMQKEPEIEKIVNSKEYRIVMGDLIEDIQMAGKFDEDKLLKIGILNKNSRNSIELYKKEFDIIFLAED